MSYKRKYQPGRIIYSLDELSKQEFIYIQHKIYHCGFVFSMQFRLLKIYMDRGFIRKAERIEENGK